MVRFLGPFLTWLGVATSHPAAFVVVLGYVALWLLLSPDSFDWHAVATVATWLMTLFIQRAEHRDTQAIHAKLDHLLQAIEKADSNLSGIDKMQPEEIEKFRADAHSSA